ncbi:DUF4153 domain-containing protein [Thioclava atlantica]|uniref:DUF4153 domain-containing protein n=1 Tax=Thioclava atlantica TaxID=1317124 RepID=A0A085U115_9RHOB|nr:DUF4153 domain-containing protein [Thioclava atlantica]KFE36662.1 hypothetical protein DW2_00850 [Thioclava atlantica]
MHTRLQHSLLGALAGLFFWWLLNAMPDALPLDARAVFALGVLGAVFFGASLAMLGEIGARKALGAAIVIALPVAGLSWWEAGTLDPTKSIAEQMRFGLLALFVLASIPLPFAMVILMRGRSAWADYADLFAHSWNIVVRYAAACVFLALVWIVLYLSSHLLELVDIDVLRVLFEHDQIAWPLAGAIFGLGLAVVTELEEMISPALILRLLRLLLPAVLVVVVVFVAGLILRRGVVGVPGFPDTDTLLAMAIAAVTLVSIGVERVDYEAVHAPILRLSAQGLSLILPVLVAAAGWIEWHQIAALGWTPPRVAEVALTLLLAGYALGYAVSVLSGRQWMAGVRRVNIAMALALLAVALLWLTPLVSPNRIATRSQIALYEAGRIDAAHLPVDAMQNDWGLAGQEGVARLREMARSDRALAAVFARDGSKDGAAADAAGRLAALRQDIVVAPGSPELPKGLLRAILTDAGAGSAGLCLPHSDGRPSCALVLGDFLPSHTGEEAMLIRQGPYSDMVAVYADSEGLWRGTGRGQIRDAQEGAIARGGLDAVIAAVAAGKATLVPSGIQALEAGGKVLLPVAP